MHGGSAISRSADSLALFVICGVIVTYVATGLLFCAIRGLCRIAGRIAPWFDRPLLSRCHGHVAGAAGVAILTVSRSLHRRFTVNKNNGL